MNNEKKENGGIIVECWGHPRPRLVMMRITSFTDADMIIVNKLLERRKRLKCKSDAKYCETFESDICYYPKYFYWRVTPTQEFEGYIYFSGPRDNESSFGQKVHPLFGGRCTSCAIGDSYTAFINTNGRYLHQYFNKYYDDKWPMAVETITPMPILPLVQIADSSNNIMPVTHNSSLQFEVTEETSEENSDSENQIEEDDDESIHPPFLQGRKSHSGVTSNLPVANGTQEVPSKISDKPPRIRYLKDIMVYINLRRENPQGGDFRSIDIDNRIQMEVRDVHPRIKNFLGGKSQKVFHGEIDILTDTVLCEVKRWKKWREAMGQVIDYGDSYPYHRKWIHFFGQPPSDDQLVNIFLKLIAKDITITYDAKPL